MTKLFIKKIDVITLAHMTAFMAEFSALTDLHPTSKHLRIWQGKVAFEVSIFQSEIRFSFIGSYQMNKGFGSEALNWLITLAKKHGVTIKGTAHRVGPDGLTLKQLKLWYARHGFKIDKNNLILQC